MKTSYFLVTLYAILTAGMIAAIMLRGPWYDEFYTYYVAQPGTALSSSWTIWLNDNHPPLYYFLTWATAWLGPGIAARRLVNLLFFVCAGLALARIAKRRPEMRTTLFYYAIALAGYLETVEFAAELRSYFLSLCLATVTVAALAAIIVPFRTRVSAFHAACLAVLLAAGFYVHFVTTIILGAVAAAFGLRLLLFRDWRGARWLVLIGLLSATPFAITLAFQFSTIEGNTRVFWIPAGFTPARWAIDAVIKSILLANPALTLCGGAGLIALVWKDWREWRLSEALSLVLTLSGGLFLALAVLIVLHLYHPIVTSRYLVSLDAIFAMIFATALADLSGRLRRSWVAGLDVVLVIGAALAIFGNARSVIAQASWNDTGSAIAKIVRRCPSTKVYADMHWNAFVMNLPPAQNSKVIPFAYRWTASRHGFDLEPWESGRLAAGCPTIFWTDHGVNQEPDAQEILAHLRAEGFAVDRGRLQHLGWGWIFVVEPARH